MRIRNLSQHKALCDRVEVADTFFKRTRGLMFRRSWEGSDGMLLAPCDSIHTFWMFMPIDVCFLDRSHRVQKVLSGMKPWRVASGGRACYATLELPEGVIAKTGTKVGDELALEGEGRPSPRGLSR